MNENHLASASVVINATSDKVWDALTNPALIKQYLFGTDVDTDWKEGSAITYTGLWEGKAYEDKGKILKVIPGQLLATTYWSVAFGLPDDPKNYKNVTYTLESDPGGTKLTITQDNNSSQKDKEHSQKNWEMVLGGLKKLLEDQATS